jgi:enoyl-CoA hydratase
MNPSCFDLSIEDRIAHIVLNRPHKRNSMIPAFWDELPGIVRDIDSRAQARVIVISSTGPHFSSGLDTSVFGSDAALTATEDSPSTLGRQRAARLIDTIKTMQAAFTCLEDCRLPVLAAIQGGAIGGAVDMITACDLRYMTADAFLSIHEINIGMTADVGTFPRLVKLLPEGIVKELAFTGRRMTAEEARAMGLVNRVFPSQEEMLKGVMEIAAEIAGKAPLAIYGSKRIINYSRDHGTADALDYIATWNAGMLQREEIQEAFAAGAEQRAPQFVDLPPLRGKISE